VFLNRVTILLAALSLVLAACSGGETAAPAGKGQVATGQALFERVVLGPHAAPGCITCHSREPGVTLIGPSLAGIAARAASNMPAKSVEEYLLESIVDPNAAVVQGFAPGIMYPRYGDDLSSQEVNDLVAYLLTLK